MWAYTKASIPHPTLFEKVANHIVSSNILDSFNSQALVNTVWASATANVRHEKLLETVANQIVSSSKLYRCNPQALANTVWAYVKADIRHPKLFDKVADHIVTSKSLNRFNPQDFANTLWAYATVGALHPTLFDKTTSQIIESNIFLDRFKLQSSSAYHISTLWAHASKGIANERLFTLYTFNAAQLHYSFISQDLANMAWVFSAADVDAPTILNDHFINACVNMADEFEIEYFSQLYQWHLWRTNEKSSTGSFAK